MNRFTEQETFWENDFGNSHISRNNSKLLFYANLSLFSKILA